MKENQGIALGQHYLTQQLPKPPCQAITPSACIIWARVGRGPPSGGLRGDQPPPTRCAQGAIYPKKTEEESPGGTTGVSFSPAAHLAPEIASENTVLGLWDKTAWTKPPAPERFQGWAAACTAPSPPLGPPNSPQIHLSLSSPNLLSLISLAGREQSPLATSGTLGTAGNYAQMRLPPMWKPLLLGCAACILIACTRACLVVSNSVQPHGLKPTRLLRTRDFSGKNIGVGSPFPEAIFPTQGLNPCLLHWQVDSLPLCHLGSPI